LTTEEAHIEHDTKASRVGEFLQEGTWRIIGSFLIVPSYTDYESGQPKFIPVEVIGVKRGENIYYCYFCHTSILEHITFRDIKSGREINIGNICVDNLGEQIGQKNIAVAKGLKSLKSKVVREYKKKIHRKDLLSFLDAGMDEWQKPANDKVNALLKENDKSFYNPELRTIVKGDKKFEVKATLWEQKDGADKRQEKARNPIRWLRDSFDSQGWNVKPLVPEFEKLIKEHGFEVSIPKPRTLNKEELRELARQIQVHTDNYFRNSKEEKLQ